MNYYRIHFKWKVQKYRSTEKSPDYFVVQNDKELLPLDDFLREAEEYYLNKVLEMYDHNVTKASEALGIRAVKICNIVYGR